MVRRKSKLSNSAWPETVVNQSKTYSLPKAVFCESQSNQVSPNRNKKKYNTERVSPHLCCFLQCDVVFSSGSGVICYIHQSEEACGSLSEGICQTVSSVWSFGT